MKTVFYLTFTLIVLVLSCKVSEPETVKSTKKEITSLQISGIANATTTYDEPTKTYTITVPTGTNIKALTLALNLPTGATSVPASGSVLDFTNPVVCTITAEDGSTQKYTIKVVVQTAPKSSQKQLLSFSFDELNPVVKATINQTTFGITAEVPSTTNIKALKPTITVSDKATVSPASGVSQDFTNPVSYTVTAEDGSKQTYTATIIPTNSSTLSSSYFSTVYAINYGKVYAANAITGEKKWEFDSGVAGLSQSSPTVSNGIVYANVDNSRTLYAIDATTGKQKWSIVIGSAYNSIPTVVNGVVYIGGFSRLYAINITTGKEIWSFRVGNFTASSPTVNNGVVYVGGDNDLYAIDATTGKQKWVFKTQSDIFSNPCFDNGLIYFGSGSDFHAIDATNGNAKWKFNFGGNLYYSSSTVNKEIVYVRSGTGDVNFDRLDAFDGLTGKQIWVRNLANSPNLFSRQRLSSPIVNNDIVYIGSLTNIVALNANTGNVVKTYSQGQNPFNTSPVICDNNIYMGDYLGNLLAINIITGELWMVEYSKYRFSSEVCVVSKTGEIKYSSPSGSQN